MMISAASPPTRMKFRDYSCRLLTRIKTMKTDRGVTRTMIQRRPVHAYMLLHSLQHMITITKCAFPKKCLLWLGHWSQVYVDFFKFVKFFSLKWPQHRYLLSHFFHFFFYVLWTSAGPNSQTILIIRVSFERPWVSLKAWDVQPIWKKICELNGGYFDPANA